MDRDSVEVFLPNPDDCYERLRRARFGATVSCVCCGESEPVIKKETTGKGAQQYRCKEYETYFNDAHPDKSSLAEPSAWRFA
jgi:transposase-like protein